MILTLETVGLKENTDEEIVAVKFSYEGKRMNFKGEILMSPMEFLKGTFKSHEEFINEMIADELTNLINAEDIEEVIC